jgi:ATP-binding cassette subfamily C (CFTR/MRP) protein 1
LAEKIEAEFMARMPPSRRTAQYRPAKSKADLEKGDSATSLTTLSSSGEPKQTVSNNNVREEVEREELGNISSDVADPNIIVGEIQHNLERSTSHRSRAQTVEREGVAEPDPEYVKKYGKKKAKRIAEGTLAVEDGILYDMSVPKAVMWATWKKWLVAVIFAYIGSK